MNSASSWTRLHQLAHGTWHDFLRSVATDLANYRPELTRAALVHQVRALSDNSYVFHIEFPTKQSELTVLPVELPPTRFPSGMVTLKKRTLSPVARLFIDTAREVARPLAKRTS